jgi:phage terminase large subunit-like protein
LAAASDKQAGRLFDAVVSYLRRNPLLDERVHRREYMGEIVNVETGGKIIRLPSSGETLDGFNPSLAICDELHAWSTPTRRRVWTSLNTGDAARERVQVVTITTAGDAAERETGILGRLIDGNEARGEVERPHAGLTVSRNREARTLVFNYSAPTTDPGDTRAMKLANPASWITEEFLARKAANPELTDAEVLQLHGCVWASGVDAWVSAAQWEACRDDDLVIPDGADVVVGVDVALVRDSSAVAVAWPRDDGTVVVQATVWSAVEGVPAHVTVPGGRMSAGILEDHIRHLGRRYRLAEVAYDERYFNRSAELLADEGLMTVELAQNSAPMADALQGFYEDVLERRVRHAGDPVLTAHLMATAAQRTDRGWRLSKIRQTQRIDATFAMVMAVGRARQRAVSAWVL